MTNEGYTTQLEMSTSECDVSLPTLGCGRFVVLYILQDLSNLKEAQKLCLSYPRVVEKKDKKEKEYVCLNLQITSICEITSHVDLIS